MHVFDASYVIVSRCGTAVNERQADTGAGQGEVRPSLGQGT